MTISEFTWLHLMRCKEALHTKSNAYRVGKKEAPISRRARLIGFSPRAAGEQAGLWLVGAPAMGNLGRRFRFRPLPTRRGYFVTPSRREIFRIPGAGPAC